MGERMKGERGEVGEGLMGIDYESGALNYVLIGIN